MDPNASRAGALQRRVLLLVAAGGLGLATLTWCEPPETAAAPGATSPMTETTRAAATLATGAATDEHGSRAPASRPAPKPAASTKPDRPAELVVWVDAEAERARRVPVVMAATRPDATTAVLAAQDTDATGRARLAAYDRSEPTAWVDFGFPTCGAYAQRVDAATDVAHLVLPDLGLLRCTILEPDGRECSGVATLQVKALDATPPAARPHLRTVVEGRGCLLLEAIALDLEVSVTTADGRTSEPVRLRGPARAGDERHCRLRLPAPHLLRARLRTAHGDSLARAHVAVHLADSHAPLTLDACPDGDGVIAFAAPRSVGRSTAMALVFLARDHLGRQWHGHALMDARAARADRAGPADDVVLVEPPLLAEGVCVDRDGAPRADITLRVEVEQTTTSGKGGHEAKAWRALACTSATISAGGAFRLVGEPPPGRRLRLVAVGQDVAPLSFAAGATTLRLVVPSLGRWPGSRRPDA